MVLKSLLKDIADAIRYIWGWDDNNTINCQDFNKKIVLIGKDVLAPVMIDTAGVGANIIKEITIGKTGVLGVNRTNSSALQNVKNLKKVTLKEGVTEIGSSTFDGCSALEAIAIPSTVTTIGTNPFSGCKNLTEITVSGDNEKYDSRNECNAIIETQTNTLISGCKSSIIPSSVETIANSAFKLTGLTGEWELPNGLITIRNQAFWGVSFSKVTIPDTLESIASGAFRACSSLKTIEISTSSQLASIGETAFFQCSKLESIYIPKGVSRVTSNSFASCSVIKYYDFSDHTSVPVLDNINGISGNKGNAYIIVPDNLIDTWKSEDNWTDYATNIVTRSEYEANQTT